MRKEKHVKVKVCAGGYTTGKGILSFGMFGTNIYFFNMLFAFILSHRAFLYSTEALKLYVVNYINVSAYSLIIGDMLKVYLTIR